MLNVKCKTSRIKQHFSYFPLQNEFCFAWQVIESLVRTHISTPVQPLVTNPSLHLLWPQPQRILELPGSPFVPDPQLHISVVQSSVNVHE